MSALTPNQEQAAQRGLAVEMAAQSIALEGGHIDQRLAPTLMAYVNGQIDEHEVVKRTRQQYGLE